MSSTSGVEENVRLAIPADPGYLRLARLTAAGLASRLGFTFDEVEDLRIAVDELCYLLLGVHAPGGQIVLEFTAGEGWIAVRGQGPGGSHPGGEVVALSERILRAIADEYELDPDGTTVSFRMVHHT